MVNVGERITLDCTLAPYVNTTGPDQSWEIQWTVTLQDEASIKDLLYLEGNIIQSGQTDCRPCHSGEQNQPSQYLMSN